MENLIMDHEWTPVGAITLLQIQLHVMTDNGGYETDALVECDRLKLTPDGVYGFTDGAWVVDRHHRHHPDAKYWHADETLSFGFSSHYEHMWSIFRRTALGRGGENVIVDSTQMRTLGSISGGLRIETTHGAVEFLSPEIAEPCVEFTRFMTDRPDADARELKPWREKLRNGVRGFVVGVNVSEPFDIATGDQLLARST